MKIHTATLQDAENIAALHADSWRRTYRGMMPDAFLDGPVLENRVAVWTERLARARSDQRVIISSEGDQLCGFICVYADEDPRWGSLIDNLHVSVEASNKGLGKRLMKHAAEWLAGACPSAAVYLWAMEANAGARRFYERLGGRNVETVVKPDVAGGAAPNCRYAWTSPDEIRAATRAEFKPAGARPA